MPKFAPLRKVRCRGRHGARRMAGCAIGQRQLDDAAETFPTACRRSIRPCISGVSGGRGRGGRRTGLARRRNVFYLRAQLVAAGETVEPEARCDFRDLPEDQVQPMIDARVRLMRALTNGAKEFAPDGCSPCASALRLPDAGAGREPPAGGYGGLPRRLPGIAGACGSPAPGRDGRSAGATGPGPVGGDRGHPGCRRNRSGATSARAPSRAPAMPPR